MTTEPHDLDLDRVPHEMRRAMYDAGHIAELIAPGVWVDRIDDDIVIYDAVGTELGRVPIHRLRAVDPALLVTAAKSVPTTTPAEVAVADQLDAAGRAGKLVLVDPPESEHVALVDEDDPTVAVALHRSLVVPGWPSDDVPGDAA